MVMMVVMVVPLAALLAPPAGLAAAAVSPVHVLVLPELARVRTATLGSAVVLLASGLVRMRPSPVGPVLVGPVLAALVLAAPMLTSLVLTVPVATAVLLASLLLAALPVPSLARLAAPAILLGAPAGVRVLGVTVPDLLVLVGLVVLAGPLRAGPARPVAAVRGVAGPVLPVCHLLVLVLPLAPTTAPAALSVSCHG